MQTSFGHTLLRELGYLIQPLAKLDEKPALLDFLRKLGYPVTADDFSVDLGDLRAAIDAIGDLLEELELSEDEAGAIKKFKELAKRTQPAIQEISASFKKIQKTLQAAIAAGKLSETEVAELPRRALDTLCYDYLEEQHQKLFTVLGLLGVVTARTDTNGLLERKVYWQRIPRVLFQPGRNFSEVYDWDRDFRGDDFLDTLEAFTAAYAIPANPQTLDAAFAEQLGVPANGLAELSVPLYQAGDYPDDYAEIRLNVVPVPREVTLLTDISQYLSDEETPEMVDPETLLSYLAPDEYRIDRRAGLLLYLNAAGALGKTLDFSDRWQLDTQGNLDAGATLVFEVRPDEPLQFRNLLADDAPGAELSTSLRKKAPAQTATALLGELDGEGVLLAYRDYGLSNRISSGKEGYTVTTELGVQGLRLRIDTRPGDGFVRSLLAKVKLDIETDLALAYSNRRGLHIVGSAELALTVPLRKKLGPVKLRDAFIGLRTTAENELRCGVSFDAKLGPIDVTADEVGWGFSVAFKDDLSGNFGPVAISDPRFLAPSGLGLDLDAGIISGAGYLRRYRAESTYAGVLALKLQSFDLTGIGIVRTRLPNGKAGFSMLISMNARFRPAIQLSFGFTLEGVGGLIGVNRSMNVQELRSRVATGTLDRIMFPRDVLKNADRLVSNLRTVFPARSGHVVVAPFLKIGWGVGRLIEVDLGVFMEFPFRARILLLGRVRLGLPNPKAALVKMEIDVLGDFNFADRYIRVEGVLRNSSLVGIPLRGGFAFVLGWGSRPQFLFSVGGYHPRYRRPALFPKIDPLSAVIRKGSSLVLTCAYYQAISSNSFQIGAAATLKAKFGPASFDGFLSFDALLAFNPFAFDIELRFGVNVRVKGRRLAGIELHFLLSGPKPWKVRGYAKIKILFFKFKIKLRLEWGGRQRSRSLLVRPQALLRQLSDDLATSRNWTAQLPDKRRAVEKLRGLHESRDGRLLHPLGYLEVRQNVLPLHRRVSKYGQAVVPGEPVFALAKLRVNGVEVLDNPQNEYLRAYFAPGQYRAIKQADQLSSPDFESMVAGFGLRALAGFELSDDRQYTTADYELEWLPEPPEAPEAGQVRGIAEARFGMEQPQPQPAEEAPLLVPTANARTTAFGLVNDMPTIPLINDLDI